MDITLTGAYRITVDNTPFTIAPAPVRTVRNREITLPDGIPTWSVGVRLPGTDLVNRTLVPGSLVIRAAGGKVCRQGRDYLVADAWGNVTRTAGSIIARGERVSAGYRYRLSRIDLVQRGPRGGLRFKQGRAHLTCPLVPKTDSGCIPVCTVYLEPGHDRVLKKNILPVRPAGSTDACGLLPERTLRKLKAKEPVTIVCLGDSITRGGDASSTARSWVGLFRAFLEKKYGRARLSVINAGIGGNNSSQGLLRLKRDVLDRRPDLVTIGFGVNDENCPAGGGANEVSLALYRKNLTAMIRAIRKTGAEVMLLTPSLKNPGWEHTGGIIGRYAAAVRSLAEKHSLSLADMQKGWNGLKNRGIPYMTYLNTCINHPNDRGHRLMADIIIKLFK